MFRRRNTLLGGDEAEQGDRVPGPRRRFDLVMAVEQIVAEAPMGGGASIMLLDVEYTYRNGRRCIALVQPSLEDLLRPETEEDEALSLADFDDEQ